MGQAGLRFRKAMTTAVRALSASLTMARSTRRSRSSDVPERAAASVASMTHGLVANPAWGMAGRRARR
jgi:hypothetical protein